MSHLVWVLKKLVLYLHLPDTSMINLSFFIGKDSKPTRYITGDERSIALLTHVLTLIIWFLPPLLIYILKKEESDYIASHAKTSFNFQITLLFIYIGAALLALTPIGFGILWGLVVANFLFVAYGTYKAAEGFYYDYPFTIRFIK